MAYAMDTLGYARRLREAGIPQPQAEALADAARDFVMADLVTKADLAAAVDRIGERLDTLSLRITVRLGAMLAAAVVILAGIIRLT